MNSQSNTSAMEKKRVMCMKEEEKRRKSRQSNGFQGLVIPKSTRRTKGRATLCDCVRSGRSIWMGQIYRFDGWSFTGKEKGGRGNLRMESAISRSNRAIGRAYDDVWTNVRFLVKTRTISRMKFPDGSKKLNENGA